jgi:hypothetical protein
MFIIFLEMTQRKSSFLMINFFFSFVFSFFFLVSLPKKKHPSNSHLSSSHTSCLSSNNIVIFDIHIKIENHSPHFFLHFNLKQLDIYFWVDKQNNKLSKIQIQCFKKKIQIQKVKRSIFKLYL